MEKRWKNQIICILLILSLLNLTVYVYVSPSFFSSSAESNITSIRIENMQSYPTIGGKWIVTFHVEGVADLHIIPVDGTRWSQDPCSYCDLLFLSISNETETFDVVWEDEKAVIKNFSSSTPVRERCLVQSLGKHALQFVFGDDIVYAYNDATDWWDSNWGYRKKITINNSQVQGSLKNFPVLVNISDDDLKQKAEVNGNDIAFISYEDNITKYHHEIENYTKGNLTAWINITRLSSITDTHFWMYYGNPFCDNQENVINTWNSNYVGVWHLNETSGNATDSTSNHNDGTLGNTPTQGVNGKIGKAYEFTAINEDYIELGTTNMPRTDGAVTLEVWAQYPSGTTPGTENLVLINNGSGASVQLGFRNNVVTTWKWGGDILVNSSLPGDGEWHQYVFTTDGETHHLYVNGVQTDTSTESLQSAVTTEARISTDNWGEPFNGIIDEVRISNTARNHSWIATSYNNIENQNEFIRVGEEESAAPVVSNPIPSDGNEHVARTPSYFEITVFDPNPDIINITWWTNRSGQWETFNETKEVSDGTHSVTNTSWVTTYSQKYWWSVNVTDGIHWTNKTFNFTMRQYTPVINSFELQNATGQNMLKGNSGNLTVNQEFSFTINITDKNGWADISFINLTAWFDNGDESSTYNQTLGGNFNLFLQYENTSLTSNESVFRLRWPHEEATLESYAEQKVNETTRLITFSFIPRNQTRCATSNESWDDTEVNTFENVYSWNLNCTVTDSLSNNAYYQSEYGIDYYSALRAPSQVEIYGAPGMNAQSEIFTIDFISNSDYSLIIYFEENLTQVNGPDSIGIAGNLSVFRNANPLDNVTFTGLGEGSAIILQTSSSPSNGMFDSIEVIFDLFIPFGTWGRYSARINNKILRI